MSVMSLVTYYVNTGYHTRDETRVSFSSSTETERYRCLLFYSLHSTLRVHRMHRYSTSKIACILTLVGRV